MGTLCSVNGARGGPERLFRRSATESRGGIEYRLVRESVVRDYRRGRLGRPDVCDAQPELLRVARNLGRQTPTDCPICEAEKLVHVSFAFGARLPAQGRALAPGEIGQLRGSMADIACYVVEVCVGCSWNHLLRMFTVGGLRPAGAGRLDP